MGDEYRSETLATDMAVYRVVGIYSDSWCSGLHYPQTLKLENIAQKSFVVF